MKPCAPSQYHTVWIAVSINLQNPEKIHFAPWSGLNGPGVFDSLKSAQQHELVERLRNPNQPRWHIFELEIPIEPCTI